MNNQIQPTGEMARHLAGFNLDRIRERRDSWMRLARTYGNNFPKIYRCCAVTNARGYNTLLVKVLQARKSCV